MRAQISCRILLSYLLLVFANIVGYNAELLSKPIQSPPPSFMRMIQLNDNEVKKDDPGENASPNQVKGKIKINGEEYKVDCDCTDKWKKEVFNQTEEKKSCQRPKKYKMQRVDRIQDTVQNSAIFEPEDIRNFFGSPGSIQYQPLSQQPFKSMDGRVEGAGICDIAGDAGSFILGLHAYQRQRGKKLEKQDVERLFGEYLSAISPRKFYMHTSKDAEDALKAEIGSEGLDLVSPSADIKPELLGDKCQDGQSPCGLMNPLNLGNSFIKAMLEHSGRFLVDEETVKSFVYAFYKTLYDTSKQGQKQLVLEILPQSKLHNEKAVVMLRGSEECTTEKSFPVLAQKAKQIAQKWGSIFLIHPEAVTERNRALANFFSEADPAHHLLKQSLASEIEHLWHRSLDEFLRSVAKRLPIYRMWIL